MKEKALTAATGNCESMVPQPGFHHNLAPMEIWSGKRGLGLTPCDGGYLGNARGLMAPVATYCRLLSGVAGAARARSVGVLHLWIVARDDPATTTCGQALSRQADADRLNELSVR